MNVKSFSGPNSPIRGAGSHIFMNTHFKRPSMDENPNLSRKMCDQNNPLLLPAISPRGYIKFEKSSIPY